MEKQKKIPQLRFPGFEGEWEKKKLGEITNWASGGTPPKENADYWNGDIPWISASSMRGTNYSDSELKITIEGLKNGSKIAKKGSLLILVRGSMLFNKIPIGIATKDVAFNQDVKSIVVNKTTNPTYILQWFISSEPKIMNMVTGTGIGAGKLDLDELKRIEISLPSLVEQTKIATFLTAIDVKIQALKKKKSLLEEYKKGVMQKIFSQTLRFKDEHAKAFPEWEMKTLREVTYKTDKKNKEKEILPVYSISNVNGFVPQSEQFDGMDSVERGYDTSLYKIIEDNTFAYNPARINVGSIGFSGKIGRVIVSSLYVCFKTNDNLDNLFFNHYLNTTHFKDSVLRHGEGGVRIYLFYENFSEITISLPSLPEQTLIANFLSAIDEKITHTQTQITQTETWKKGLLQKMFV